MQVPLKILYLYDYIKLCKKHAEVIQNHRNPNARTIEQGEAMNSNHKRLRRCGGQDHNRLGDVTAVSEW
jgi:hypothetical protein